MRATLTASTASSFSKNGRASAARPSVPIRYICPYGHHSRFYVDSPAETQRRHAAIITSRGNLIGGPEKGRWWLICGECGDRFMADVDYQCVEIDRAAF